VRHVPNILTIDKIDKLLEGKHPDTMCDIKHRFRMGLFLAKPKKDPLTRAFLNGSMMERAYDFSVPEDISDIPDEKDEEIQRIAPTAAVSNQFSYKPAEPKESQMQSSELEKRIAQKLKTLPSFQQSNFRNTIQQAKRDAGIEGQIQPELNHMV